MKKNISGNKNKQSNDDDKDNINSGNEDGKVDKTENENVRNVCERKDTPQKVTTKKEKRTNCFVLCMIQGYSLIWFPSINYYQTKPSFVKKWTKKQYLWR